MKSSWLPSAPTAPLALVLLVPAELVRTKAHSGDIVTSSAMRNLTFSVMALNTAS
jgi:hypothetical protein